ncbi:hypothetical protein [Spiroplasma endosymbiont of Nephrotoma flavescens]|uniref:hypothetical protein n=1 Tax=Spiroplasma endosymbiont of Nephrotoma flavescens TaxID=3066302 RepID=UPI00313C7043
MQFYLLALTSIIQHFSKYYSCGPSIFQVSASVGYKIAGITGALLASFVAYLPNMIAFIFLATLQFGYFLISFFGGFGFLYFYFIVQN